MRVRIEILEKESGDLSKQVDSLNRKIHEIRDNDRIQQDNEKQAHLDEVNQLKAITKGRVTNELDKILNG